MNLSVKVFTFNPFQENTYLIWNEKGEAIIVDAGCYTAMEQKQLLGFIQQNNLRPNLLLNTHCHIDHVLGNAFCTRSFGLLPRFHALEQALLDAVPEYGTLWGIIAESALEVGPYLVPNNQAIQWSGIDIRMLHTPGHSPGSITFVFDADGFALCGDVIFKESIGRTDLPGGHHAQLLHSIQEHIFTLPPQMILYPGHGPHTTVGHEQQFNPFFT